VVTPAAAPVAGTDPTRRGGPRYENSASGGCLASCLAADLLVAGRGMAILAMPERGRMRPPQAFAMALPAITPSRAGCPCHAHGIAFLPYFGLYFLLTNRDFWAMV